MAKQPSLIVDQPGISSGTTTTIRPQSSTTVTDNGLSGDPGRAITSSRIDQTVEQIVQDIIDSEPPRQVTVITNKPAGNINGEIQFYSNGNFAVDKDFKYDSSTDSLRLNGTVETVNLQVSGRAYLGIADNIWIGGGYVGQYLTTTANGNLGWISGTQGNSIGAGTSNISIVPSGNITMNVGGVSNVFIATTTGISVTGNAITGNVIPSTNNVYSLGNSTNQWKELWITGNTIYLGNVPISIEAGNVLTVANAAVLTEDTVNTGNIETTANVISNSVIANSSVRANSYILGNSVTTISTTRWLDAITNSTVPTVLFSTSNTVSSVDVHITAVQGNSKQITKMLSVTSETTTNYSQYGNISIGGEIANFIMDQVGGQIRIVATATTTSLVDYRLIISLYA